MAKTERKDNWFKRVFQARVLSADFYRHHAAWIILAVGLILVFITFKYHAQMQLQEIIKLRNDLANERTNMVKVSAEYSSRIRESEMRELVDTLQMPLSIPEQPPYNLDYEENERK